MINILKLRKLQKDKNTGNEEPVELREVKESNELDNKASVSSEQVSGTVSSMEEPKKKTQKKTNKKLSSAGADKKKNRKKESAETIPVDSSNNNIESRAQEVDNSRELDELLGEISEIEKEIVELQEESYIEEKSLQYPDAAGITKIESTESEKSFIIEEDQVNFEETEQLKIEVRDKEEKEENKNVETDPAEILRANLLKELLAEVDNSKVENKAEDKIEVKIEDQVIIQTEQVVKPVEVKKTVTETVKPLVTDNFRQYTDQSQENKPIQEISKIVSSIQKSEFTIKEEAKKKTNENIVQLVGFMLSNEYYGVDIMRIREIIRMVDITRVPRAPHFIEGVINLRGTVLPVINLRTKIRMPRLEYDKSTRIVIVEIANTVVGFIVDAVREVLRIQESVLEPPPPITIEKADYITSVAKLEDQLVILMDTEKVLSNEEGKALSEMAK